MIEKHYQQHVDRSSKDYTRPFGTPEIDFAPLPKRPWKDVVHPRIDQLQPGFEVAAFTSAVDRSELSGSDRVALLRAHQRLISHYQAELYRDMLAILQLLEDQEGIDDPVHAALATEAEIRAALAWTRRRAEAELALALDLDGRHPEVLDALARGDIDVPRARAIVHGTDHLDEEVARKVVAEVLAEAIDLTTGQIAARVRKLAARIEPEAAAARYGAAHEQRRIVMEPTVDGTANVLGLDLAPHDAAAVTRRINRLARGARHGDDDRTPDQLKADVFIDLLLGRSDRRSNGSDAPNGRSDGSDGSEGSGSAGAAGSATDVEVRVDLTTLMGLDDEAAEVSGFGPVVAEIARGVVRAGEVRRARYVVTDPVTGRAIASGPLRRRPDAATKRSVRATHPRCVFPGCRAPAMDCDLDHTHPWASGGTTSEENLAPLCRRDHRVKTVAGWDYTVDPERGIVWRSPTGRTYRSPPPE